MNEERPESSEVKSKVSKKSKTKRPAWALAEETKAEDNDEDAEEDLLAFVNDLVSESFENLN